MNPSLESQVSRRSFLIGAGLLAASLPLSLLTSCTNNTQASSPSENSATLNQTPTDSTTQNTSTNNSGNSILVVYFSATGNTEKVANTIAEHLKADTFAITPVHSYSAEDLDYNNSESRVSQEREADTEIELTQITPENFDSYSTIFIGYPIWWGNAAWPINSFVSENDFSGKTVIPFCTSGGSPLGNSGENLAGLADSGTWLEGNRFSASASQAQITNWIDGLEI